MAEKVVEVLWVARYDYHTGWQEPHDHDYYQMIYVIDGIGHFRVGDQIREASAGKLFFLSPFLIHHMKKIPDKKLKTYDVKFIIKDPQLQTQLAQLDAEMLLPDLDMLSFFRKIREEGLQKRVFYKEFSDLYLQQLLLEILRVHANKLVELNLVQSQPVPPMDVNPFCQQVIDYIKKHYQEELTLKSIAAALGYNQSYVCQMFKNNTKNTVMHYLYHYRIEKAKELIVYSDYDLKEIAMVTGFKTIHHFTRLFHKIQGLTPGQWREREKEGIRKGVFFNEAFKNQAKLHTVKSDSAGEG